MKLIETSNDYLLPPHLNEFQVSISEWKSLAEFWKLELKFFDKLLRIKNDSTDSEYGDKIIKNLQSGLLNLYSEHLKLASILRKQELHYQYLLENNHRDLELFTRKKNLKCRYHIDSFSHQIISFKKVLFEFSKRW